MALKEKNDNIASVYVMQNLKSQQYYHKTAGGALPSLNGIIGSYIGFNLQYLLKQPIDLWKIPSIPSMLT